MPLSDDVVVVRGGTMRNPEALLEKIQDAVEDGDGPVLSVFCAEVGPGTREAAVLRACQEADLPHSQVRVTTAGTLRAAGLELIHEPGGGQAHCHYHVVFGSGLNAERVGDFIQCLDEPIPNPTGGKQRRGQATT